MFIDLITRQAMLHEYPSLRAREKRLDEAFERGEMTLTEGQIALEDFLLQAKDLTCYGAQEEKGLSQDCSLQ